MKTLETVNEFNDLINKDNIIALFSADWCPDCRVIEPVLPEIEQDFPEYTFVLVDRDQFIEICQQYDVFGIPSFIAFKGGKEAGRFVSKDRKTKDEIIEFIKGV
ncbi:thioredoxin family protein [Virgibacillus litoralis]|uniref:Thiol-disulfide isomerase/thioredoxin n=1 Tax=Virgibacillus litoralis TaxID=578221 RepID=A0ABS4HAD6_9BACI|nr:thioredoxin family protein [Virgibacillus litoralis]MBP1947838.1 thiol-disulfide isomerase/thioredoxin [Virgibacillus litoralis]